jgi:predicted NBD/HSP70 family sugar kinase
MSDTVLDPPAMRARNRTLLLERIWREQRISRADLARVTGMSPSTVSAIVAELTASALVRETGAGVSRGGRPPVLVGFCDDAYAIVGVELGASHITVVLSDLRGKVAAARELRHPVREDPAGTMTHTVALIEEALRAGRISRRRILGIGVAVPSPVHPDAPGQLSPLLVPKWRGIDLRAPLEAAFDVPVMVDNDANLGALAEQWWGAGVRGDDLAYIKIGTGVGSGHIIRGQLYRGAGGIAGEIGHLAIDPAGPECVCGLRGCLVTLIGAPALRLQAQQAWSLAEPPALAAIVTAARRADPTARQLVDRVGTTLGIAVAGLLNLLNPGVVVLGGEIASLGELLLEPLRATVRARALAASIADTRIVTSELGSRAIAVGAATQVLQAALADPSQFPTAASTYAGGAA